MLIESLIDDYVNAWFKDVST